MFLIRSGSRLYNVPNTRIPDRYSTRYSTSNKGRLWSYFRITIPGQVICRSLVAGSFLTLINYPDMRHLQGGMKFAKKKT